MNDRPKIGAVSYLNTKPLVFGLDPHSHEYQLEFDLPSRLADRLAVGQLDVGLIPVIKAVTNPDYTIISDACIACRGPVWSVKLFSRVPPQQIKTLALDEGSRTSQILAQVLLNKKFGIRPATQNLPIDQDWRSTKADAVLVIGDRAMTREQDQFPFTWDLGTAWSCWTGDPFVFAVWAARPGVDVQQLDAWLTAARDAGQQHIDAIAKKHAPEYRLSEIDCRRYLKKNIHYYLGDDEKRGMQRYFDLAAELAFIPKNSTLQFFQATVS